MEVVFIDYIVYIYIYLNPVPIAFVDILYTNGITTSVLLFTVGILQINHKQHL